ncbi:MAG: hypothetical protein JWL72_893 [Ilumatobacteraceae bacterium]|nr:hypothetical protein [Ilumatobacteraceae bacterium]
MAIETLPSGKLRAVVRHGGRKMASKAVKTRAEAKVLEAELMMEMAAEPDRGQHTVREIIEGFTGSVRLRGSAASADYYEQAARLAPDWFLDRDVSTVDVYVVDVLYKRMIGDGMTPSNVVKFNRVLSAACSRALKYSWISSNPCKGASKPRTHTPEITPPTVEQVQALISEAVFANEDLAVALRVSAQTGVRRGELVALKWSDLASDRLSIRRSMVESQGEILISDTKTHSRGHRTISLDAKTVAQLETLRVKQTAIAEDHLLPAPVWMFSHDAGVTAWRPEYMTTAFQRLNKTLKFAVRLHDLRHFHATQLLSAGVDVTTVSRRLGHAKVSMTLDTYSHWLPSRDRDAADVMGALL